MKQKWISLESIKESNYRDARCCKTCDKQINKYCKKHGAKVQDYAICDSYGRHYEFNNEFSIIQERLRKFEEGEDGKTE